MSKTKGRDPMLSGKDMEDLLHFSEYQSADNVRSFYERLITTGKLRVVEEAEWDMEFPREPCCPICNYGWDFGQYDPTNDRDFLFYPCCGSKIKRP